MNRACAGRWRRRCGGTGRGRSSAGVRFSCVAYGRGLKDGRLGDPTYPITASHMTRPRPRLRPGHRPWIYVFTREAVRKLDRLAVEEFGVPLVVLMENAARHVTDVALA